MKWDLDAFVEKIFKGSFDFEEAKNELWHYQLNSNQVLREFADHLGSRECFHLPIEFFKSRKVLSGSKWEAERVFESSGTTGQIPSRHYVKDLNIYENSCLKGFFEFFPRQNYRVLALLPSYLERGNSSLVQMAKIWMDTFGLMESGFFLKDFEALERSLLDARKSGEKVILLGVAFALLDFAEQCSAKLPDDIIVIETGGMKGRKEEITRRSLHEKIRNGLGIKQVYSEYGMTELLSQAYTGDNGRFRTPPWMRVEIGDIHLPSKSVPNGFSGRIMITDLANIHSCAFIATEDIGILYDDGSFEVLGRVDQAELRGCSLMYN